MNVSYIGIISIQQKIIDEIFVAEQYELLLPIMLLFSAVVIVHVLAHVFGGFAYVGPTKRVNSKLSSDFMEFIHKLPIQELQKERVAKYVHYFSSDIPSLAKFITTNLPSILADIASLIFLIYLIGSANWLLVLFISIVSVLYGFIAYYFKPKVQKVSKEVQDKKSEHLVVVEEGISSTREVLAFHQMDWEKKRYDQKFEQYFSQVMGQGKLLNKQLFVSEPIKWGVILIVLGFGGYLVLVDQMTLGMFVVLYAFTNRFMESYQLLFENLMDIAKHLGYVERIRTMMEKEQMDDGQFVLHDEIKKIDFKKVSFSYGEGLPYVLQQLSIHIPAGKKIAFVGTSGGGKSTIAQLLIRFFEPTEGQITVNGMTLSEIRRKDWQKRVDIVFQEPYLFPDTIRMNITLGREDITEEQVIDVCKALHIDHVFQALPCGYDTEVGERGITLSGGQRQRLALARSILHNPEVLLLDEATSALDLETERRVLNSIDTIREGKTTIVIAHRLSTVKNADLIFVMDKGQIVEQGSHKELMKQGRVYKQLVYAQKVNEQEEVVSSIAP